MELGAFGGATLDRIVREEIPPVDRGREPGEDLGNGNGSWEPVEQGPSGCNKLGMQGGHRAIAQSRVAGNQGNGGFPGGGGWGPDTGSRSLTSYGSSGP